MSKALNPWPWETLEPGIYFDLDFETKYLPIQCLSSTYFKKLLISITDFYNVCWFNPLRDETDVDADTVAKLEGRAQHKRTLEGRAAFYAEYAPDYEDMGDKDVLRTGDDIREALNRIGRPMTFKNKPEGARRLLAANPAAKILDVMIAEHKARFPDREFLPAKMIRQIELTTKMIEVHPIMRGWLAGGYPEVTIIWDDPVLGVRCKIRVDYLKITSGLDLKTYANVMDKNLDVAIRQAIFGRKYDLQAWLYVRGIEMARKMAAEGKIFGDVDPEWIKAFAAGRTEEYRFIFVKKKSPVVRGKWFSVKDPKFAQKGEEIEHAAKLFRDAYTTFGETAWIDMKEPDMLTFDELY